MEAEVIVSFFIVALSGVSKAVKDKITHHYNDSIFSTLNPLWWDPELSWNNKYNSEGKPKFFGSTTFLVAFTDAWHLFQLLETWLFLLSVGIGLYTCDTVVESLVLGAFLLLYKNITFEIYYRSVFKKR